MDSASQVSFKVICADVRCGSGHHVALCRFVKKCPDSAERTCCLSTLQTSSEIWPAWVTEHTIPQSAAIEYKFLIVSSNGKIQWEVGHHRFLCITQQDRFTVLAVFGIPGHQILSGFNTPSIHVSDMVKEFHATLPSFHLAFLTEERSRAGIEDRRAFEELISQFVDQVVDKPAAQDSLEDRDNQAAENVERDKEDSKDSELNSEATLELEHSESYVFTPRPSIPVAMPVPEVSTTFCSVGADDDSVPCMRSARSTTFCSEADDFRAAACNDEDDEDDSDDHGALRSTTADAKRSPADFSTPSDGARSYAADAASDDEDNNLTLLATKAPGVGPSFLSAWSCSNSEHSEDVDSVDAEDSDVDADGNVKAIREVVKTPKVEPPKNVPKVPTVKKLRELFEASDSEPSSRYSDMSSRLASSRCDTSRCHTARLSSSRLPSSRATWLREVGIQEEGAAISATASEVESHNYDQMWNSPEQDPRQAIPEERSRRDAVPEETPEKPKFNIPRLEELPAVQECYAESFAITARENQQKSTTFWGSRSGPFAAAESALAHLPGRKPVTLRLNGDEEDTDVRNQKKEFVQRVIVALFFLPIPRFSTQPQQESYDDGAGFQYPVAKFDFRRMKVMGALAAASTIAGGSIGGAVGTAMGSASGAIVGLVPALFTFGLSIPVGAVIGGSIGLGAGATGGGGVGLAAGLWVGDRFTRNFKVQLHDEDSTKEKRPEVDLQSVASSPSDPPKATVAGA